MVANSFKIPPIPNYLLGKTTKRSNIMIEVKENIVNTFDKIIPLLNGIFAIGNRPTSGHVYSTGVIILEGDGQIHGRIDRIDPATHYTGEFKIQYGEGGIKILFPSTPNISNVTIGTY